MFGALQRTLSADDDPICQQMGRVMASFKPGLFAGGDRGHWPSDDLDLERWFRLPKGHERRIHGRCHAGVRIVQEGATMMLALDAHRQHPQPFTEAELRRYRDAEVPHSQKEVIHRRKVMRAVRRRRNARGCCESWNNGTQRRHPLVEAGDCIVSASPALMQATIPLWKRRISTISAW